MSELIEAMERLMAMLPERKTNTFEYEVEQKFVNILAKSHFSEISAMLDEIEAKYWFGFPVWARNLTFRLACLLEPNNAQIRRRAAADLLCWGPDWDAEADRLGEEAEKIEMLSNTTTRMLIRSPENATSQRSPQMERKEIFN